MTDVLRSLVMLLGGGWLGAMLLFAFVVAPTAFGVLDGAAAAGQVIGPVLRSLHLFGIGTGVALAALAFALRRPRWLIVLPVLLAAASAYSEFVVTGEMSGVLPHDLGGPGPVERAERFAILHRLSMGLFTAVGLGAGAVVIGHVRADRGGSGRWG